MLGTGNYLLILFAQQHLSALDVTTHITFHWRKIPLPFRQLSVLTGILRTFQTSITMHI